MSLSTPAAQNLTSPNQANTTLLSNTTQVSWQSALWGLTALSLNAMTQRSAADTFPSSESLSPARSSPFICLADICILLCWLLQGRRIGLHVHETLRWYRREMGLVRGAGDRGLVQGVPAVMVALFVLGPLPQAVKVFGMVRVPWTKVWAVVFFVAWVVEVAVRFAAGVPSRDASGLVDDGRMLAAKRELLWLSEWVHIAAFATQLAVWLWMLSSVSNDDRIRGYFAAVGMGVLWMFGIGLGIGSLGIGLLQVLMSGVAKLTGTKKGARSVYVASSAIFLFGWAMYFTNAGWSIDLLKRMAAVGGPLGFLLALMFSFMCLVYFVMGCTWMLVGMDFALKRLGDERIAGGEEEERLLEAGPPSATDVGSNLPPSALVENTSIPLTNGPGTQSSNTTPINVVSPLGGETTLELRNITGPALAENSPTTLAPSASPFTASTNQPPTNPPSVNHRSQFSEDDRKYISIAFAVTNLLVTLLYYCIKYSPEGTVKPGWTEMLG